ncbi:12665_t:CDS:2, partial [Rhizophagus irregularis]
ATNYLAPRTIFSNCDTGLEPAAIESEFNARMSSIQCVESINAIIHKFMNSHSILLRCFNGLQEMLASELQKAEYRDYLANLPFSIASSSAIHVFPKLVENLKSILTDEVFFIQKA